jgi:hypothetical protein
MKNLILSFALFLVVFQTFSQEETGKKDKANGKNEVHINVAYLLGGIPEIGYEYILNEESGVGLDILFAIDNSIDFKFALTPYYRFYFGKKKAAGFFVEGFGMINTFNTLNEYDYFDYFQYHYKNITDFALGASVGGKFLTTKGFVFEIYGGAGRNLFNNDSQDVVPRFGLTFGKRF